MKNKHLQSGVRMQSFEKSCFLVSGTMLERISAKNATISVKNREKRYIGRRAVVSLLQKKNFGPNVIYCFFTHSQIRKFRFGILDCVPLIRHPRFELPVSVSQIGTPGSGSQVRNPRFGNPDWDPWIRIPDSVFGSQNVDFSWIL